MIAYHFPPLRGSSGIQRTLHFAQTLPQHDWEPAILTVQSRAYEQTSSDLLDQLPSTLRVQRAFALDARHHLSLFQRYPAWLARPDRWVSWLIGAIPAGLKMIRVRKPDLIWSTYPIPSAHLIGYWLSKLSGIRWVADFRDPMAHEGYPADAKTWQSYLKTEQRVFSRASLAIFATQGAAKLYRQRYPFAANRIKVVENGYDENTFSLLSQAFQPAALNPGKITILHSGIVYPEWRNPSALFKAIQSLIEQTQLDPTVFSLRFRAPIHQDFLTELAERHQLADVVEILPPISYRDAIAEMLRADGLLLLQSKDCNDQIPAKFYEYLRAMKPILGITDLEGDTAQAMRNMGLNYLAPLDNEHDIAPIFRQFIDDINTGKASIPNIELVKLASREERARELAVLLNELHAQYHG